MEHFECALKRIVITTEWCEQKTKIKCFQLFSWCWVAFEILLSCSPVFIFLFRWPLWFSFILNRICEIHSALLHTLIMNRTNEIVIISHSTSKWVMVELPHDFFFWFFFRFLLQQIQSVYFQTMQCNLREIKSLIRTNNNKMHSPNLFVRQTAPLAQWIHIEPWVVSLSSAFN